MLLITWLATASLSRDTALLAVTEQKQNALMSIAIKEKHGVVDIIVILIVLLCLLFRELCLIKYIVLFFTSTEFSVYEKALEEFSYLRFVYAYSLRTCHTMYGTCNTLYVQLFLYNLNKILYSRRAPKGVVLGIFEWAACGQGPF